MAKSNEQTTIWTELLRFELYKRTQGRLVRQLTAVALSVLVFFGAWSLSQTLGDYDPPVRVGIPLLLSALGVWVVFRVVNLPRFADFLISVEAEMDKVSWPSWQELYRATVVVIGTMFFLGLVLFLYDWFWQWFFELIRFLRIRE